MPAVLVNLPPSVHAAVARKAQRSGRTIRDWVGWAVQRSLRSGNAHQVVVPVRPDHRSLGWTETIVVRVPAAMVEAWDRSARGHQSRSAWAADRVERWIAAGNAIAIQGDKQGAYGGRACSVKLRFQADEAQIIRASADAAGVSVSAFVRTLLG